MFNEIPRVNATVWGSVKCSNRMVLFLIFNSIQTDLCGPLILKSGRIVGNMLAGNAYPSGHLVPSPILGLASAPIIETKFLELAMSLLDFSPRIPLGTFSILLFTTTHVPLQVDNLSPRVLVG